MTAWLTYFSAIILRAQADFLDTLQFILQKTDFFDVHKASINERQRRVIAQMFEEGTDGVEGE